MPSVSGKIAASFEGSPRVYLAIDNCFAYKRWTSPSEWAGLVRELGLTCIEASADTEAHPLYAGPDYLADWTREVRRTAADHGVQVVNLYSGHGTYSTLGLGHPDAAVRNRMRDQWIKPMVRAAADLGAGMGFFCHAFPHRALQDPSSYNEYRQRLVDSLSDIARFGKEQGARGVGVEQMYSPHLVPWTVAGARELLRDVYARGGAPLYLTVDTGHAAGQRRFLTPTEEDLRSAASRREAGEPVDLWLGTDAAHQVFEAEGSRGLEAVSRDVQAHPYLFAAPEDCDPYRWLSALGAWSPIVHLQQVTGGASAHEPFTAQSNARGSIHPRRVLEAIAASWAVPPDPALPPRPQSVYLTLEIFAATAAHPRALLEQVRASIRYWRQAIPEDGMSLGRLIGQGSSRDP